MKAARLHSRGGPEQIVVEEAPLPVPEAGEVRVKVQATAITPDELTWDQTYSHSDGSPRLPTIPGHDLAGVVERVGAGVESVSIGEAVFGLIDFPFNGAAAQFTVVAADFVAPAPRSLDAVHAAAVPLSGLTAWQALFEHGHLSAGQRVLIHGAAGGVGTYAVQLAKSRGGHVIATASSRHHASLRALGVDEVIDYSQQPFENLLRDVDLVFDTVGGGTASDPSRRSSAAVGSCRSPKSLIPQRAIPLASKRFSSSSNPVEPN